MCFIAAKLIHHGKPVGIGYYNTFRESYPPNSYDIWVIEAKAGFFIEVQVVRFEPNMEISSIYIGTGKGGFRKDSWIHLEGDVGPWESVAESSSVTIILTSGNRRSGSGFTITCSAGRSV